jgi:hypothetical protein
MSIVGCVARTDLKPTGPITAYWAPRWSYLLSAVQVHNTLQVLQRTALGPASPKANPGYSNKKWGNNLKVIIFKL